MKTYPYTTDDGIIELVRKDEHDAVVAELKRDKRTQVAVAFGGYVSSSEITRQLLADVKTALSGGMSHCRSRLELAVSRHSAAMDKLTFNEPPSIKTDVRLFDLVRFMRSELHEAELITDDEYAWLCSANPGESTEDGSPSRERLEAYDDLRAELSKLRADNAELLARLRERTESHLAASARDVATIQRQAVELAKIKQEREDLRQEIAAAKHVDSGYAVLQERHAHELSKWQALAEQLAGECSAIAFGDIFDDTMRKYAKQALVAYDAAKKGDQP